MAMDDETAGAGQQMAKSPLPMKPVQVPTELISAEESMSAHAIEGAVRVHLAAGGEIELRAGNVLALEPELCHDFEASEDATLLLTLAWTGHRTEH